MITLKSKLAATLAVFLIASIVLSSYIALTAAAPKEHKEKPIPTQQYSGFLLDATGTAENSEGMPVEVHLVIDCKVNGKMTKVIHIRTQAGGATITDETVFDISATKGQGIIVNKNHFIHLNVMMSGQYYGGRSTVWILRGTVADILDENEEKVPGILSVELESRRVVLPKEGYPQLRNLDELKGTITFYN